MNGHPHTCSIMTKEDGGWLKFGRRSCSYGDWSKLSQEEGLENQCCVYIL
ncbi:hypothetical protein DsansV1_C21g0166221 [Dioscorea sansibarensis]